MFKMSLDGVNSDGNLSDIPSANTTPQKTPQKPVDEWAVPANLIPKQLFPSPKKQAYVEPAPFLPIFTSQPESVTQKKRPRAGAQARTKVEKVGKDDTALDFNELSFNDLFLPSNANQKNQENSLVTAYGNFKLPPELPPEMPRTKSVSPTPESKPIPITNPRSKSR